MDRLTSRGQLGRKRGRLGRPILRDLRVELARGQTELARGRTRKQTQRDRLGRMGRPLRQGQRSQRDGCPRLPDVSGHSKGLGVPIERRQVGWG